MRQRPRRRPMPTQRLRPKSRPPLARSHARQGEGRRQVCRPGKAGDDTKPVDDGKLADSATPAALVANPANGAIQTTAPAVALAAPVQAPVAPARRYACYRKAAPSALAQTVAAAQPAIVTAATPKAKAADPEIPRANSGKSPPTIRNHPPRRHSIRKATASRSRLPVTPTNRRRPRARRRPGHDPPRLDGSAAAGRDRCPGRRAEDIRRPRSAGRTALASRKTLRKLPQLRPRPPRLPRNRRRSRSPASPSKSPAWRWPARTASTFASTRPNSAASRSVSTSTATAIRRAPDRGPLRHARSAAPRRHGPRTRAAGCRPENRRQRSAILAARPDHGPRAKQHPDAARRANRRQRQRASGNRRDPTQLQPPRRVARRHRHPCLRTDP